ncbi:hypothetical protein V5R04_08535 [Jonesiaceae bacterium BS-20]|uniref:ABC transporter permease n=1 Tax=Jonesiaceae bacterium BS-20 TaxID=3120821 RepID=A0AAU7DQT5_9MICO
MNNAAAVTKLHFNKRELSLLVPACILLLATLISVIVALALGRAGMDPNSAKYIEGFRGNTGVISSIAGFLVYLGVQAVATTFPFGMSLGTTRKAYTFGTIGYYLIQSGFVAAVGLVLLGIEKLTGHWFVHAYVMDSVLLGNGNPLKLVATIFVLTFTMLSIGGVFGAVFVKAGAKGPLFLGISLALLLALAILFSVPYFSALFAGPVMLKLLVAGLVIALVANCGTYLGLRTASVR